MEPVIDYKIGNPFGWADHKVWHPNIIQVAKCKAVANGPVGQVLARPLINKSTRVIFGLI